MRWITCMIAYTEHHCRQGRPRRLALRIVACCTHIEVRKGLRRLVGDCRHFLGRSAARLTHCRQTTVGFSGPAAMNVVPVWEQQGQESLTVRPSSHARLGRERGREQRLQVRLGGNE